MRKMRSKRRILEADAVDAVFSQTRIRTQFSPNLDFCASLCSVPAVIAAAPTYIAKLVYIFYFPSCLQIRLLCIKHSFKSTLA